MLLKTMLPMVVVCVVSIVAVAYVGACLFLVHGRKLCSLYILRAFSVRFCVGDCSSRHGVSFLILSCGVELVCMVRGYMYRRATPIETEPGQKQAVFLRVYAREMSNASVGCFQHESEQIRVTYSGFYISVSTRQQHTMGGTHRQSVLPSGTKCPI